MQTANTPAESLLCRLQQAENFTATYDITIEKKDAYTRLYIRVSTFECDTALLLQGKRPGKV